ncbi:unnamed protein product [Linum trigynum]|uniref:Uncharacterized protein n=1 Tax=Linum trigynum TaxID=586398 RepID=A0AAV2CTT2_9ROSI
MAAGGNGGDGRGGVLMGGFGDLIKPPPVMVVTAAAGLRDRKTGEEQRNYYGELWHFSSLKMPILLT